MSSNPRPAEASAVPSRNAAAGAPAEGNTLTVPLRAVHGGMAGRLVLQQAAAVGVDTVRLHVAPPAQPPLNLTL